MRKIKRIHLFSILLALTLAFSVIPEASFLPGAVTAQAASKKAKKSKKKTAKKTKKSKENPTLSKKAVKLKNKKSVTIKVKNTKKTIKVKTSDKSVAKVKRSGKYAFKITAAKKKKGCAVISVKTSKGWKYVFVMVGDSASSSSKTAALIRQAGLNEIAEKICGRSRPNRNFETEITDKQIAFDNWMGTNSRTYQAEYDAKVAEICGVNDQNLSKYEKLSNYVRWISNTYPYNALARANPEDSYYPEIWNRFAEAYPEEADTYGFNDSSVDTMIIRWAGKYLGCMIGMMDSNIIQIDAKTNQTVARIELEPGEFYLVQPGYSNRGGAAGGFGVAKTPLAPTDKYHPEILGQ